MKLQTKVTLSESQKAQIVARGEVLQTEYTFEMSAKYAAIFARLDTSANAFQVDEGTVSIMKLNDIRISAHRDADGRWINSHQLAISFNTAIATGILKQDASCDPLMQNIEKLLDAKDEGRQAERQKAEDDAARQERERPAKEAREAREAEEKRIERDARKAEEAERSAARQAEIDAEKAEKLAWIKAQGSERLQKGIASGYHCQKIYVAERGKTEIGSDYILDYDEKIATKDRSCPTLKSLNEAERVTKAGITARVKWLPRGIDMEDEDDYYDEPSGCEAVEAVFLGSYFYREMA